MRTTNVLPAPAGVDPRTSVDHRDDRDDHADEATGGAEQDAGGEAGYEHGDQSAEDRRQRFGAREEALVQEDRVEGAPEEAPQSAREDAEQQQGKHFVSILLRVQDKQT